MSAPLLRVLEAGDRLTGALHDGDLLGAAAHLHERQAALDALLAAPPAADPALAARVRDQDGQLRAAFQAARRAVSASADDARRTASALAAYHPGLGPSILDTARR